MYPSPPCKNRVTFLKYLMSIRTMMIVVIVVITKLKLKLIIQNNERLTLYNSFNSWKTKWRPKNLQFNLNSIYKKVFKRIIKGIS